MVFDGFDTMIQTHLFSKFDKKYWKNQKFQKSPKFSIFYKCWKLHFRGLDMMQPKSRDFRLLLSEKFFFWKKNVPGYKGFDPLKHPGFNGGLTVYSK